MRQYFNTKTPLTVSHMKPQSGWINISLLDILSFMLCVAAFGGFILFVVIPWLWALVKPIIHQLTV